MDETPIPLLGEELADWLSRWNRAIAKAKAQATRGEIQKHRPEGGYSRKRVDGTWRTYETIGELMEAIRREC